MSPYIYIYMTVVTVVIVAMITTSYTNCHTFYFNLTVVTVKS